MSRRLKRQRSVHCPPEEQEMIREQARAAGKTISGYLLDLALNDDPDIHPLVLSPGEQEEVLNSARDTRGVVRALRQELPGTEGLGLFAAVALLICSR